MKYLKLTLLCATSSILSPMTHAFDISLNWQDNAYNEDGYIVRVKEEGENSYKKLIELPKDTSHYTHSVTEHQKEYCYQVLAFNYSGNSDLTSETCITTPTIYEALPSPTGNSSMSYEMINKPVVTELGSRYFYSLGLEQAFNDENATSYVDYRGVDLAQGRHSSASSEGIHEFTIDGEVVSDRFKTLTYTADTRLNFVLMGDGSEKVATLYMISKNWTPEPASFEVMVGEKSYVINPVGSYRWNYLKLDITFDGVTPVSIVPLSDLGNYSYLNFSGIVINHQN